MNHPDIPGENYNYSYSPSMVTMVLSCIVCEI